MIERDEDERVRETRARVRDHHMTTMGSTTMTTALSTPTKSAAAAAAAASTVTRATTTPSSTRSKPVKVVGGWVTTSKPFYTNAESIDNPMLPHTNPNLRYIKRNRFVDDQKVPFNRIIIGGTLSLSFLLLLGGILMYIIYRVEIKAIDNAQLDDFVYLGNQGCQILNTSSYSIHDKQLKKLRTKCYESWTYNVKVVVAGEDATTTTDASSSSNSTYSSHFMSNIQTIDVCSNVCEECLEDDFHGRNYYRGIYNNRPGRPIIQNKTFTECWISNRNKLSVEELSSFYDCNTTNNNTDSKHCYLLINPIQKLQNAINSNSLSKIAAYVGILSSIIFFMLGMYWMYLNKLASRKLKKQFEMIQRQQKEQQEKEQQEKEEEDKEEFKDQRQQSKFQHQHMMSTVSCSTSNIMEDEENTKHHEHHQHEQRDHDHDPDVIRLQCFFRSILARDHVMKLLDEKIEELKKVN